MSQITFHLRTDHPVVCPICREIIIGNVGWVLGNMLFCRRCAAHEPDTLIRRAIRRRMWAENVDLFVLFFGISALCPPKWVATNELKRLIAFDSRDPDDSPFSYHCCRPIMITSGPSDALQMPPDDHAGRYDVPRTRGPGGVNLKTEAAPPVI